MEQVGRFGGCFLGRAECSDDDPCTLHHRWAALRDGYLALLTETTLNDLLSSGTDVVDLTAVNDQAASSRTNKS